MKKIGKRTMDVSFSLSLPCVREWVCASGISLIMQFAYLTGESAFHIETKNYSCIFGTQGSFL